MTAIGSEEALSAKAGIDAAAAVWQRGLSAEKKGAIRALHRLEPWRNSIALVFAGVWAAVLAGIAWFPIWPVRVLGYLVIGLAIHGLAVLMHEASHGNSFRDRRKDRWFAFVCGAPALLSASAYRTAHLFHHRDLRGRDDPEEFRNLTTSRWIQSAAFYAWALIGGFSFVVMIPAIAWSRGSRRERVAVSQEYGIILGVYAIAVVLCGHFGRMDLLIHGLVFPWLVVNAVTNVRGWAEHAMTPPGEPLRQTRVVTSSRALSLLVCNVNYHLEHHLYPGMPWYNLRKLHVLLSDEYQRGGAIIYTSYLRFLGDALRVGLHGIAEPRSAASIP